VLEVADAVVDKINTAWAPVGNDSVSREYLTPIEVENIIGRKVYVFAADYSDEWETRSENLSSYTIALIVAERCQDAGQPSKTWLDERVKFVNEKVWDVLSDVRTGRLLDNTVWPQTAEVLVYDVPLLNEKKLFWSEIEISYREVAEA